ncbi:MAG TPA: dipeptide ABC transporter ATP-binding protein [Blastocatellia bacterium]|jgi:oligopeptide/dipeptide ABC transporter ATP-binding protein|nr:dipeptide ABC transporter ATP-binding protein [Blastocatellia bacterium]
MARENGNLVEVRNLKKYFPVRAGALGVGGENVRAVDGVSFAIRRGETFGLVGESGCGKSTTGRCILRLVEPSEGEVIFDGNDLLGVGSDELRRLRRDMQIIFQDPYSSLNPRMRVGEIIEEPLIIHRIGKKGERRDRVAELLRLVGLDSSHAARYPHEFSGGQRQRIGIARALALNPKFIVCDEPVSALDVSVQAQVVNLLQDLQEQLGLTYLFISHGLSVVEHISNRVGIMYLGKLVEVAPSDDIFHNPLHPYTRALLSAIPVPDPDFHRERVPLTGDVPTAISPPSGCRFRTRCPLAVSECEDDEPRLVEVAPDHFVACKVVAPEAKK